ncbi:MAG: aggregation factor core [Shimia sp.]|uniref:aggregation factor core n=1 Tax=Shimia sp. TaxID=1954381 RepID=UPI00405A181E
MTVAVAALVLPLTAGVGQADLHLRFVEGAPKDRFEITNHSACALTSSTITLDLAPSQGALIFDVTGSGAGVEVFQPFEIVSGRDAFAALPTVKDGQNSVDLSIATLDPGKSIAFTIDVDDTLGAREITVTGSEISGATVQLEGMKGKSSAQFDTQATAQITGLTC